VSTGIISGALFNSRRYTKVERVCFNSVHFNNQDVRPANLLGTHDVPLDKKRIYKLNLIKLTISSAS
jgi:hypothetical protein